jgi:hypothetical protein
MLTVAKGAVVSRVLKFIGTPLQSNSDAVPVRSMHVQIAAGRSEQGCIIRTLQASKPVSEIARPHRQRPDVDDKLVDHQLDRLGIGEGQYLDEGRDRFSRRITALALGGDSRFPGGSCDGQTRMIVLMRSRSSFARPYICRLSILIRMTWPSTAPELRAVLTPASRAVKARARSHVAAMSGQAVRTCRVGRSHRV